MRRMLDFVELPVVLLWSTIQEHSLWLNGQRLLLPCPHVNREDLAMLW